MSKSICLVFPGADNPEDDDSIRSSYIDKARFLKENGWQVTVLTYPRPAGEPADVEEKFPVEGVKAYCAAGLCKEADGKRYEEILRDCNWPLSRSHLVHESLQLLVSRYGCRFDIVEFPERGGAAYVPVNMSKNFRCYSNTRIIVNLAGPTLWLNDVHEMAGWTEDHIILDHMERYSFENADVQAARYGHLARWCAEHMWRVRSDAAVINLRMPDSVPDTRLNAGHRDEIVLVAETVQRQDIVLFGKALELLGYADPCYKTDHSVTLVVRECEVPAEDISVITMGYRCKIEKWSDPNVPASLGGRAKLLIISSRLEDPVRFLSIAVRSRIPFIAARTPAIKEVLGEDEYLFSTFTFDSFDHVSLADRMASAATMDDDKLYDSYSRILDRAGTDASKILRWYEVISAAAARATAVESLPGGNTTERSDVTIIVPVRNDTVYKYLDQTLDSLSRQTYRDTRVLVVDSSTDQRAVYRLEELRSKYPVIEFVHRDTIGVEGSMNYALELVGSTYVMEVDGDNLAPPDMVETFLRCMENRPDVAALSCYFAAFLDGDEVAVQEHIAGGLPFQPLYFYKAIGPCMPLLYFYNVQGDSNSIFRTSALKAIGGWPDTKRQGSHDWIMWCKLLAHGYQVDVVRRVLFYYRVSSHSTVRSKKHFYQDHHTLKQAAFLLERDPVQFMNSGLLPMFRIIRQLSVPVTENPAYQAEHARAEYLNNQVEDLRAHTGRLESEVATIKGSTLYLIGAKLGTFARRLPAVKKGFEAAGNLIKKLIGR